MESVWGRLCGFLLSIQACCRKRGGGQRNTSHKHDAHTQAAIAMSSFAGAGLVRLRSRSAPGGKITFDSQSLYFETVVGPIVAAHDSFS